MNTYTSRRNTFGTLVNNSATATLAAADILMNTAERRILSSRDWNFLWRKYTKSTVANQQTYQLPAYTRKPQGIYITVSNRRYVPEEVSSVEEWNELNQVVVTSDSVTHYFIYDGQIELYPIPATSANTITFNARRMVKDLSRADYTTGTIVTVATSGVVTTVTGTGTAWSAAMIGRFIQIAETDAANAGDGFWYEIATVPSATTLTLVRTYGGTAITAGSVTYTIGQVGLIPEDHDMLPMYEALKIYYTSVDPSTTKAELYNKDFIEGYDMMVRDVGGKQSVDISDCDDDGMMNPNNYVTL